MKKILLATALLSVSIASQAQLNDIINSLSGKIDGLKAAIAQSLVSMDTIAVDTVSVDTVATDTVVVVKTEPSPFVGNEGGLPYLRKVYDNAVYAKNVNSKISLGIKGVGKDLTLDGKLQMRKGQVIRITIVPFGLMEVARLEFTPTYVLLIDRMHKEYVKASYDDVAFLRTEGLTFYTLQSLFWNELFQPGKAKLSDSDLRRYSLQGGTVSFKQDKMLFTWQTNQNALITSTNISYGAGTKDASSVSVSYGDFTPMGVKQFPKSEHITFNTKAFSSGSMSLNIDMRSISTDADWEPTTNVSGSYKQVTAEEFFSRLGKL